MTWIRRSVLTLALVAGCKTVVTTTTEIHPSRYAAAEITRRISGDSALTYAAQAVQQENLKIRQIDRVQHTLSAGPARFAAAPDQPALDATITISAEPLGDEMRIRIFASSVIEQNEIGGQDARLVSLVQRLKQRLETLVAP
jgi:hypothetical protein